MPGFTIHIAIGKEYIKKHKLEIKNEKEFIKGSIAPDLTENFTEIAKNKDITHYGIWKDDETKIHIDKFLNDKKVDLRKDFWKGYFLHLLTDKYFYNQTFKQELEEIIKNNDKFYNDYDCLNEVIIEKYKIDIEENIKKYMNFIKKEPKYLKKDKVIKFIEDMSQLDLNEEVEKFNRKECD